MICLVNGEFKPVEEASIGINDLALLRGYGIFDFFRLSSGIPLFIDDHIERFFKGADAVRLPVSVSKERLKALLLHLFNENQMPVSGVRLVLTGGYTSNGYEIGEPNLIAIQEPITFPTPSQYAAGVPLITYDYLRDIPTVKTINYMTGIWLKDQIREKGAYDVIYLNEGNVLELTRSNIFLVTDNREIITPKENVLHGITRKKVLEKATANFTVFEKAITVEELMNAQEVFLTGTTKKVLPINQIDDHHYGQPGEVTQEIMQLFHQCEEEYLMRQAHLKK